LWGDGLSGRNNLFLLGFSWRKGLANHGASIQRAFKAFLSCRYGLSNDFLPEHSIPLIIHHALTLGEWIRCVEDRERVTFHRDVSTIAWWQLGDRFVL